MFKVNAHVEVHVHVAGLSDLAAAVPTILAGIGELKTMITEVIQALRDEVIADADATNSIVTLLTEFAAQVEANKANEPALTEILAGFKANTAVLAAAAVAHTTAAPPSDPPVDVPPVVPTE